jgi:Cu2+-exporting ATPase
MNQATTAPMQGRNTVGAEAQPEALALDDVFAERPKGPLNVTDNFAVLDDPVEQTEFTQFADIDGKRMAQSVLMVQGMYCAACADTVEGALCNLPGVAKAEVHAATRRLTVQWDPAVTRASTLAQAVGQTGYRLLPMHEALSITQRIAESRKVLWRLFVAGICMMQVMMYAWPAYITEPGDIPPDIEHLLRWASWVLSVPVLLFASGSFFGGAWRDLKQGRVGMDTPVSIGIVVTFVASSLATFDPTGPWGHEVWYDSLTMFVFFLMGGRYLEFKARDRTAGALDNLMNRLPEVCDRRKPDGSFEPVSVRRLVVGDVVRVQAGQAFPGDGTLTATGATVDEALLTGESHPVLRAVGETVVAGSYNLAGPVELRVDRLGRDTRFAQIVSLMERASTEKPRLAVLADRIAGPFLSLVLLAALAAGVYWWQIDHTRALAVAVAVLIVTCPCALSLATPAAMLASAGTLARRGVLVRRLQAFETLAQVHTVVFDKTGTLTHDKLQLASVAVREGFTRNGALSVAGALASGSLHPASKALASAMTDGWGGLVVTREAVVSSTEVAGQGLEAEVVGLGRVRLGSASFCSVPTAHSQEAESPRVYLADSAGWLATFELDECLRSDAVEALAALKAAGVKTWLLSGDLPEAAQRIARLVGVDHVVSGATPEQKLLEITQLQAQGLKVAMVGDGLNDGPVLARSDTSFALGTAAPLAQANSDYVIQGGRLMDVPRALIQARSTMRVVHQNLAWAAAYNAVSVPLALMGYMPPWAAGLGMAISSFWVIGNALRLNRAAVTDSV